MSVKQNAPYRKAYISISLLLMVLVAVGLFRFTAIKSNARADNGNDCPYYITLQSILTNYPPLAFDKANSKFIKHRLLNFERDLKVRRSQGTIIANYKNNYKHVLAGYQVKTIKKINNDATILAIAHQVFPFVDGFYLDERITCINPLYEWLPGHSRRILKYNIAGIFYQLFDNYTSRALFTNDRGEQLGVFPGYNVNNQTTTLSTQFLTGLPLLTAIYVLPGYDFNTLGSYQGLVPWCGITSKHITDNRKRKLFDIAGIDYFVASKYELSLRKDIHDNKLPATKLLPSPIKAHRFGNDFAVYQNLNSYGLAYLANNITYLNKARIQSLEKIIQQYFARPEKHNTKLFIMAVDQLTNILSQLKTKHDIVLEDEPLGNLVVSAKTAAGGATVLGMVGHNIVVKALCLRSECEMVLNNSAAPGWVASVNGKNEPITRANFAFMAVSVPAGESVIWFIYEPWYVLVSYFTSILGLIFIASIKDWRMK